MYVCVCVCGKQLRDGPDENSGFVYRYCGNSTPPAFTSHNNALWIKFRSDYSHRGAGFRAVWNVGQCRHHCPRLSLDAYRLCRASFIEQPASRRCRFTVAGNFQGAPENVPVRTVV